MTDGDLTLSESLSEDDQQHVLECKINELIDINNQLEDELYQLISPWLHDIAGPMFSLMTSDQISTLDNLSSADAGVRRVAIHLIIYYWNQRDDPAVLRHITASSVGDPDQGVRMTSLGVLGVCYYGTQDLKVGKTLASTILDHDRDRIERSRAYVALLRIHGLEYSVGEKVDIQMVIEDNTELILFYHNS